MPKRSSGGTKKLALIALLVSSATLGEALADTVVLQGSTTFARRLMEPHKAAIEADSKHEITVIPNKSLPGLIALMEGRAHMAMISSPLKSEIAALQKAMPGLSYDQLQTHEIVSTRIAIALHPTNRVRKTSIDLVKKILKGELNNWNLLGGTDRQIRVVLVGGGGGITTIVESELLDNQRVEGPHVIYLKTPVQLVQVVAQERGAIGFAQLSLVTERKLPELLTEQPIEQTLSLVTYGALTPAMNDIIQASRRVAGRAM